MNESPLILIIEDEEDILELEEFHLANAGYEVLGFRSAKGVEQALQEEEVALLVVDRNLPGVEGSELVRRLRDQGYTQPVIFVTARDRDEQVQEGFERGGDDYLRKPFNMNELVWRVAALLRRVDQTPASRTRHRDLLLDPQARRLERSGTEIALSRLEFDLLHYLMLNRRRVISREELLEEVWGDEEQRGSKSVNVAINRLKKKIDRPGEPSYIESVRGVGYRLC